jgi:CheY-like chemotaxis protein
MKIVKQYVVVDDDHLNNMLCSINIRKQDPDALIYTFTDPEEGLQFLKKIASDAIPLTVAFLDINMPSMTGWDFMEQFRLLGKEVKSKFKIFIVTSSVDMRDIERASRDGDVVGITSKPLKLEGLTLD